MKALRLLLGALVLTALAVSPVAATPPTTETFSDSYSFELPAGEVCDFAYGESATITGWVTIFYDADGNYVRDTVHVSATIVHVNLDTGYTLTESINQTQTFTERTDTFTVAGTNWLLKDDSGRVVLAHAGYLIIWFELDDYRATPNFGTGFNEVICPALGGNPA